MFELITALACFICSLPFWQQVIVTIPFALTILGLIYLAHCAFWTMIIKAADALGVELVFGDDEDFDASWMDAREWRRSR